MKKYFIILFIVCFLSVAINTFAATGVSETRIPNPLGEGTTINDLIDRIITFLLKIFSPIAVIMVLYAGLLFMTSAGSTEKVQKAKKTLTWAIVGIAILMISKGITITIKSFFQ